MNITKINKWLASHNFECTCELGESEDDFCYDHSTETIYIGTLAENSVKPFMKYAKSLGFYINAPIEVLAFLHELGHYNTLDFIDDEVLDRDEFIKTLMEKVPNTNLTVKAKYFIYHRLAMEKAATLWAINYANTHPAEVIVLSNLLLPTVTEYCPNCQQEVEIQAIKYRTQICPVCHKPIKACCICDNDKEVCCEIL